MRRYACVVVSSGMRRETVQPASKREIGRERERERIRVVSLGRDKGILEVRGRARSITCTVSMQVMSRLVRRHGGYVGRKEIVRMSMR